MRARLSPVIVWLSVVAAAMPAEPTGVWLDVPFVAQEKNGCGAASIAMLIEYWQRERGQSGDIDARAIHRDLYSAVARGVHASDLQRYLRGRGFRTYAFSGEWEDLLNHLRKGRPLIVALKSGRDDLHYVVATGIDPEQGLVFKHDPAGRKLMKQHRAEFENQWQRAGNWTLLAVPDDPAPAR
jgi:ABC-type bacteriocin/lantibiotic exporter with double-glycine peptidase domain